MPIDLTCHSCGDRMCIAQDPDDNWPEIWCHNDRGCEHPKCDAHGCGDERPGSCDMCGLDFCKQHLQRIADADVCAGCKLEVVL